MINKYYIIGLIICVVIAVIATLIGVNFMGWGTSLSGAGGPVARGLYNVFVTPFTWAASGGWPTLAAGLSIIGLLMILSAYAVWHYDIPYKITGATQSNPAGEFTNTTTREPCEPERAPQPIPQTVEKGK